MDKLLHTGWVKWLAGLLMMFVLSTGIYFGVRVVAAVESGGLEVLNGNIPGSYEQSRHCAGDLAQQTKYALYNELQVQRYKADSKNSNETAMTVIDYAQWIGTQTLKQKEGTPATESATEESPATEEAPATEESPATEGAPVTEEVPTTETVPTTESETYTYEYLLSLRNTNKVTEDSGLEDVFFYDEDTDEKKPDEYVRVNRDELIEQVISHADYKYVLNEEGNEAGSDEDWDTAVEVPDENGWSDGAETIDTRKQLYQYEATVGENVWSYNEVTKMLNCSRFGQVKQNVSIFYHQTDLEKYADGFLADGRQDAGAALLAAPMCYLDGLIEYYTRNLVLLKEREEVLTYMSENEVNYRYRIELQDGTVLTNMKGINDITEGASVFWSYDYGSREMSGTMTDANAEHFYDILMAYDYTVVDENGSEVNLGLYLQDNAQCISVAMAKEMKYQDEIKNSKAVYEKYSYLYQNARGYMFITVIMGIVGLVLFGYLLLVVGYQDRKGTLTRAPLSFRIPTEILLLLVFILCVSLCIIVNESYRSVIRALGGEINFIAFVSIGMLWSILPIAFEMLSRLRHREFLARSICFRGFRYVFGRPVHWFSAKLGSVKDSLADVMQAVNVDAKLCAKFMASQIGLCFLLLLSIVFFADSMEGMGLIFLFLTFALEILVCLVVFRDIRYTAEIIQGVEELKGGNLDYQIPTEHMKGHKKELAENINHLQNGLKLAVEQSIKDERLKTELITNVSHDIKTPLTSIINYVDLLKKEPTTDETSMHYLEVLDQKSQRLKQLMEDLVEVSKSATGNVDFTPMRLDLIEMLRQILGEFEDKFASRNMEVIENFKLEVAIVNLDSRHTYRVFENLCQNIYKYAMENSRIYVDVYREQNKVYVVMKNISQYALNISADELMERFVRGDESRNTSGSGLGLSITRNLVTLQQGEFTITLDGDLFKATVIFPLAGDGDLENASTENEMAENGEA